VPDVEGGQTVWADRKEKKAQGSNPVRKETLTEGRLGESGGKRRDAGELKKKPRKMKRKGATFLEGDWTITRKRVPQRGDEHSGGIDSEHKRGLKTDVGGQGGFEEKKCVRQL